MPFINSKLTVKLSEDSKERLKREMGKIISEIPGKSESWLMVEFEDDSTIYFKGEKDEDSAFVEVKLFGNAEKKYKNRVAELLSELFETELGIQKERIYITFEEVKDWAWNGAMF